MVGQVRSRLRLTQATLLVSALLLTACAGTDSNSAYDVEANGSRLVALSQAASMASVCSGCHGNDASNEGIVSLNGYSAFRISILFRKYKNEPEGSTAMHRMARGYTDAQIKQIARYLATESR
jgi:sulfide dehydrogenase cytochrome subunit